MKKRNVALTALTVALFSQPISVFASAAPDGKTDASSTAAAQNGAWQAWVEKWAAIENDWTYVSLAPGSDETQMNFAWYSKTSEGTSFTYGESADLSDGVEAAITSQKVNDEYTSNKVSLTGLKPGQTYYYQVLGKEIASFTTEADTDQFSFIFVGDPQIGSSNEEKAKTPEDIAKDTFLTAQSESVRNDAFNWNNTLNQAYAMSNNTASFILSAGDQIQTNAKKVKNYSISEKEYTGYLSADLLKSLPVATTVGNHDADNPNYLYHFNIANSSELGSNDIVGGDYYYTYGDVLFIMLNTQDTNVAEHKEFIENTVANNPDCKWRVVTLHQDIYGSAEHSNEPEIVNLRYALTPIFEENDIDVVLTGHDHAYSRSNMLKGGQKEITYTDDEFDEQLEKDMDAGENPETLLTAPANIQNDTTDANERAYLDYLKSIMDEEAVLEVTKDKEMSIDSDGILYMTAGSSSGSKYYDLVPRTQTYIASAWQEDVPTYSIINVTETTFTINTYRTDTNEKIDSQFTLVKSIDHSQLSSLIDEVNALNKDEYTDDSYAVLMQALEGAVEINALPEATSIQLANAYAALQSAKDSLVKKEVQVPTQPSVDEQVTTNQTAGQNTKPVTSNNVDTGDHNSIIVPVTLMAVTSLGSLLLIRKKKESK